VQERLERLIIVNPPSVFRILSAALSPFMDSVTKAKVHLVQTKHHDDVTGRMLSGDPDPSGLHELWHIYKAPFDEEKYTALLLSLEKTAHSSSGKVQVADNKIQA
jgi:CRAL/TRIO domain